MTESAGAEPLAEPSRPKTFATVVVNVVLFPFRILLWILGRLLLTFIVFGLIAFPTGLALIVLDLLVGLLDLIFRLHFRPDIHDWLTNLNETFVMPFVSMATKNIQLWSDQLGITALLVRLGDALSDAATEIARALILFTIFLVAGFAVYHLRIVHRVRYALLEFGVAIIAMWIAIDGMSGGDFSLKYLVALLSGLYIMVRSLQNADEAFREKAAAELERGESSGIGQASLDIWRGLFYGPYEKSSFDARFEKIKGCSKIVFAELRRRSSHAEATAENAGNTQEKSDSDHEERPVSMIDRKIIDELVKHRYKFVFDPTNDKAKIVTFKADGTLGEGQNENEDRWQITGGRLEILNDKGEIYSRFYVLLDGTLWNTDDPDTRSNRGQHFEPLDEA